MEKGPRFAEKMIFHGFRFIMKDENLEIRLRVKWSKKQCLFSTDPIASIWIQEGAYHICTATEHYYWLELSKIDVVKVKQIAAIQKIMDFLKGDISAERIFFMEGSVRGTLEGERFYYAV